MPEPLPPDPDAVERWKQLPQNKPTRQALPPATNPFGGAGRWLWIVLAIVAIIGVIVVFTQASA